MKINDTIKVELDNDLVITGTYVGEFRGGIFIDQGQITHHVRWSTIQNLSSLNYEVKFTDGLASRIGIPGVTNAI